MPNVVDSSNFAMSWRALLPLVLGVIALYLLLPKPRKRPVVIGAALGVMAVVLGGALLFRYGPAPVPERILFWCFAVFAILGAGTMLTQRNPARAAISFTLVVMNVCGLFLLQGAPFLMAATIIIYAGAIIVTFLFVLMLAQQRGFSDADDRTREPFIASFAGFVLLGTIFMVIEHTYPRMHEFKHLAAKVDAAAAQTSLAGIDEAIGDRASFMAKWDDEVATHRTSPLGANLNAAVTNLQSDLTAPRRELDAIRLDLQELAKVCHEIQTDEEPKPLPAANVAGLGYLLYSKHLLAVEIAGTLLLVATIGAIAIAHRRPEPRP